MRATQGLHVCIVSFSYPSLRDTVLVTLREVLQDWGFLAGEDYEFIKSEMSFQFIGTDGKIILRSGDRPDALRGLNLNFFYVDEAREFPDDSLFNIMIGRLRREGDRGWRISSTTKGKSWFWELEQRDDVEVVKQITMANPFLPDDYIEELLSSYTSDFARQELYAEEVEFGAGIVHPEWFQITGDYMQGSRTRFWDIAVGTKKHNDFSAGGKLCKDDTGRFQIQDIKQVKMQWPELKEFIIDTADLDGPDTKVVLENAGQQVALYDDLARDPRMSKFNLTCEKPNGSKMSRLMAWASRLERGQITLFRDKWNKAFIDEAISFTADDSHAHDDMLDSISGAWQSMNSKPDISFGVI